MALLLDSAHSLLSSLPDLLTFELTRIVSTAAVAVAVMRSRGSGAMFGREAGRRGLGQACFERRAISETKGFGTVRWELSDEMSIGPYCAAS